jgi:hypothetical protein
VEDADRRGFGQRLVALAAFAEGGLAALAVEFGRGARGEQLEDALGVRRLVRQRRPVAHQREQPDRAVRRVVQRHTEVTVDAEPLEHRVVGE